MKAKIYAWMFTWAVRRFVRSQRTSNWSYCLFGNFLLVRCRLVVRHTSPNELFCLGLKRCAIRSKHFNFKIMLDILETMAARYDFEGVAVIVKGDNPGLQGCLIDRGYKRGLYLQDAFYKPTKETTL